MLVYRFKITAIYKVYTYIYYLYLYKHIIQKFMYFREAQILA